MVSLTKILYASFVKKGISVLKEYNLRRHYVSNHKANFEMLEDILKEDKLKILKSCLEQEQRLFISNSKATVHTSFALAHVIAKLSKSFTDVQFLKECPDKQHLIKSVN